MTGRDADERPPGGEALSERPPNGRRGFGSGARRVPLAAWGLGAGGLLPFAAGAVLVHADPGRGDLWGFALWTYGAVILSFLGGARWGRALALSGRERAVGLGVAVLPALAAWGLGLLNFVPGLGPVLPLLALAHLAMGALDWWAPAPGTPPWYRRLRLLLTAGAALALFAGAAAFPYGRARAPAPVLSLPGPAIGEPGPAPGAATTPRP